MVAKIKTKDSCLKLRKEDLERFGQSEALHWIPDQMFGQYLNLGPISEEDYKNYVTAYTIDGGSLYFIPRDFVEEVLVGTRDLYVGG